MRGAEPGGQRWHGVLAQSGVGGAGVKLGPGDWGGAVAVVSWAGRTGELCAVTGVGGLARLGLRRGRLGARELVARVGRGGLACWAMRCARGAVG
jgi:hypothetical protein